MEIDEEFTNALKNVNLYNPTRLKTKGLPNEYVRCDTTDQASYNHALTNKVKIGSSYYTVDQWKHIDRPLQCFKCQSLGHHSKLCKSEKQICPICANNHTKNDCPRTSVKCVNCNSTEHTAMSHNCPKIIEHMNKIKKKVDKPHFINHSVALQSNTNSSTEQIISELKEQLKRQSTRLDQLTNLVRILGEKLENKRSYETQNIPIRENMYTSPFNYNLNHQNYQNGRLQNHINTNVNHSQKFSSSNHESSNKYVQYKKQQSQYNNQPSEFNNQQILRKNPPTQTNGLKYHVRNGIIQQNQPDNYNRYSVLESYNE